jgi:hypothetical protein
MFIHGKVAAILNERDLVINRGRDDGVSEGMLFNVSEPNVSIKDPDSGVELGVLTREKIKVRVFEVHSHFSVAKTYETYAVAEPPALAQAGALFVTAMERSFQPRNVTRVRRILLEPAAQKTVTIGVEGSTVNIGDPVTEITE